MARTVAGEIERVGELLLADEITAAEKHGLLACVVRRIVPTEERGKEGLRLDLLPAATGDRESVQSISIW